MWLDCCIQIDCSEVSQITTNSKIRAKVKNVKLENKYDNMFIFAKIGPQNVAVSGSTDWDQDIGTGTLLVPQGFLSFCSAFFPKIFLAVKYLALSFLGSTS